MSSLKIYIAGPYSDKNPREIMKNVWRAVDAGIQIWKKGHYPFVPHLTHWIDERAKATNIPMEYEEYLKMDAPWVDVCDALLHLGNSNGADMELARAKESGKIIFGSLEEIPTAERTTTWVDEFLKKIDSSNRDGQDNETDSPMRSVA